MKKIIYILFGMIIFMCLGTIYSYSVFRKSLELLFNINSSESGLPYMVFLFIFALTMPIAGRFIDKIGPRLTIIIGGIFVSFGWILSGYVTNIYQLTLTYGLIAGCGVGIVYGAPLSTAAKWFPNKKGLAMGLTLAGFGLSPIITAPIASYLIHNYGSLLTFKIIGTAFLFIIILLSLPLRYPKENEVKIIIENKNILGKTTLNMLKSIEFYVVWFCYLIGTLTGLTIIGITSPFAQEIVKISAAQSALFVSIFAIFNGVGRPFFGYLTDKYGFKNTSIFNYLLIIIASLIAVNLKEGNIYLFLISFSIFWFILGGWLSIAPASTISMFGVKHYSENYGVVFTAYGIGAVLGVLLSGYFKDIHGSYIYFFYPVILLGIIGILTILFVFNKKAST